MSYVQITVNGYIFKCRANCTVELALSTIRSRYGLRFGGLVTEDGVALLQTDLISDAAGEISFIGGQSVLQGVNFSVL